MTQLTIDHRSGRLIPKEAAVAHPYSPSTVPSVDGRGCLYRPQLRDGTYSRIACNLPESAHAKEA